VGQASLRDFHPTHLTHLTDPTFAHRRELLVGLAAASRSTARAPCSRLVIP
jgi:hypothetical protein